MVDKPEVIVPSSPAPTPAPIPSSSSSEGKSGQTKSVVTRELPLPPTFARLEPKNTPKPKVDPSSYVGILVGSVNSVGQELDNCFNKHFEMKSETKASGKLDSSSANTYAEINSKSEKKLKR